MGSNNLAGSMLLCLLACDTTCAGFLVMVALQCSSLIPNKEDLSALVKVNLYYSSFSLLLRIQVDDIKRTSQLNWLC